jgi:peptidoglycan/LPS O-acetylase OafA/YrhL
MTKGGRIPELDLLRGVAIFGVLVLHSSFEGRFAKETMAVQAIMARFFDWAVLAFFFSSGFLHDRSAPFAITLKKRIVSLLVPFFLYNMFYNLCFFGIESMGWPHAVVLEIDSKSLGAILFRSPAFQLYFLPYLFMISVGVSGLEKLCRRFYKLGYFSIFVLILIFYLNQGYPEMSHGSDYNNLPMYLAMFLIGLASRPFFEKSFDKLWMILAALCVVLSILVIFKFCVVSLLMPPLLLALAGGFPVIRRLKPLFCMGEMSGSIYLWHTPLILPAISRLLTYCGIPSLLNLLGSLILTLIICMLLRLGLDALFVMMIKKNAPKYITL